MLIPLLLDIYSIVFNDFKPSNVAFAKFIELLLPRDLERIFFTPDSSNTARAGLNTLQPSPDFSSLNS